VNQTAQLQYADILQNLNGLDDWLRRLGVPVLHDRVHHAIRVLQRAQRAFGSHKPSSRVSKSDYLFGLTEALELHDVYLAFHNHPPQRR
jgi:hypothetical protein